MAETQSLRLLGEAVFKTLLSAIVNVLPHFGQALTATSSRSTADCKRVEPSFRFPPTNSYKILVQSSRDARFSFPLCQCWSPSTTAWAAQGTSGRAEPESTGPAADPPPPRAHIPQWGFSEQTGKPPTCRQRVKANVAQLCSKKVCD